MEHVGIYIYIWDVRWDIWTMVPWWPNWLWTSVHPSLNNLKSKDQNLKISSCRRISRPSHQRLRLKLPPPQSAMSSRPSGWSHWIAPILNINIGIIEKDWMLQVLNRPSLHRQLPKNSPASVVQSFWQSWSWLGGHSRNLFYKCLASTPNWNCFLHLSTTVQCRASEEIHSLKLHSSKWGPGPDLNDMKCQWKIPNESNPGHRTRNDV